MRLHHVFITVALAATHLVQAQDTTTQATVRKLDLAQGKITLAHEALQHLDMPPMTMVFRARHPAQLLGPQPGQRVVFRASHEGGQYWAEDIHPRPTQAP